jgi:hypothetical protein
MQGEQQGSDDASSSMSTIQNGSLQIPIETVWDRWPQNLQVYSRWQLHMQGEQQGSDDASSSDRQQPHV